MTTCQTSTSRNLTTMIYMILKAVQYYIKKLWYILQNMEVDIKNMSGQDLRNEMFDLVDNEREWRLRSIHKFMCNQKLVFKIRAAPTRDQPGNGIVTFSDRSAPRWEDLRSSLLLLRTNGNSQNFNDFLSKPVSNYNTDEFKASVLLLFEIARRIESPSHLSRNLVERAILTALANMSPPAASDPFITDLIKMFTAKRSEFDRTMQARLEACNRIIRRQTDSASTAGTSGSVAQKRATSRGKKQDASVGGMEAITAEMEGLRVSERATSRPVKQPGRSAKKTGSSRK